jgi:phosphate transport system protein
MRLLEHELLALRKDLIEMWKLVNSQVINATEAIMSFNQDIAQKVVVRERKVDAFELKIDSACEHILALYHPLANDLRFVLAVMKINSNLERIADFAYGISKIMIAHPSIIIDAEVISDSRFNLMSKELVKMLNQALESFDSEMTDKASSIFFEDTLIDEINNQAPEIITHYLQLNPDRIFDCLQLIGIFRKMERIGDHCSNIAEEIIFYIEAKVIKHSQQDNDDQS